MVNDYDGSQDYLLKRFNTVLDNVLDMIKTEGPIYSVWIKFQLGKQNPIMFDSTSTDINKNIIAGLEITKGSNGMANEFTLTVQYDPFNYGQLTKTQSGLIEQLDEYIATAIQPDWNADINQYTGFIQYGYNNVGGDKKLCSPKYEFILSDADAVIKYDSGLATYTFRGVSHIAMDCEFSANFTAVTKWRPLDLVVWILYYYYGDVNNKPNGIGATDKPCDTALGYAIDIPQSLLDDQFDDDDHKIDVDVVNGVSPWSYCQTILANNCLTKSEQQNEKYADLGNLDPRDRPRYVMYITDLSGKKTIHIAHYASQEDNSENAIKHPFTWSLQNKNLVTGWNPKADLFQYMTNKLSMSREKEKQQKGGVTSQQLKENKDTSQKYKDEHEKSRTDITEIYDATLEIVGIPSDPPMVAEVTVIPRVLETVSRTAGVYVINGCVDNISTNGIYTTTLNLVRARNLGDSEESLNKSTATANSTAIQQNTDARKGVLEQNQANKKSMRELMQEKTNK